jgi:hypothetical protein
MDTLAETHKAIRCIVRTCGEWDYEISARITDPRLSSSLAQKIHKYLEKYVSNVLAVPELYCHKIYVNPEELGVLRELLGKSKSSMPWNNRWGVEDSKGPPSFGTGY